MNFKGTLFNPGYHPTKALCGTKLSDIMAQGKIPSGEIISLHVTEIKGKASNRNSMLLE